MFRNQLKIAWRNLVSRKAYSMINIVGLAVGIGASLLIFLVIRYELSYDNFHSRKDDIYRVVTNHLNKSNKEVVSTHGSVPIPFADAFRTDFPQVKEVAAVWNIGGAQIHIPIPGKELVDEKRFKEDDGLFFVEPAVFKIFDFTFLSGNATRLTEPNTTVLNETTAKKYFGDVKSAIGQTIQMWSFRIPLQVVGVYQDLPENTDIEIKMGASYATFEKINERWFSSNDWENLPWSSHCFVLLPGEGATQPVASKFPAFVKKYYTQDPASLTTRTLALQPLAEVHLDERYSTYKNDALTKKELWSLALIGFFLLFVACINFVNLATAQSVNRAREIGVRKVLGSSRTQILKQFLNETALITFTAITLGFILARIVLPSITSMMEKPLSLDVSRFPEILLFLFLLGAAVNFLAGFYPGMVLAGFNPVQAIKSKISNRSVAGISLRRGLVVFQFVIAQFLIIGTIVVIEQMKFFRTRPLGFDKDSVVLVELPSDSTDRLRYGYLKSEMLKIPGVQAASFCLDAPASFGGNYTSFYFDNRPELTTFNANLQFADTGFLGTFKIGLKTGRIPFPSDTLRELLVNETLVKALGFTNNTDIIGKTIAFEAGKKYPVVGVMQDFHSKSLKEAVAPFILAANSNGYNFISLKLDADKMPGVLQKVETFFTATYPTYIFDLTFLDERIARFYSTEAMASQLFKIAAVLAIFISCLGLYGLVSFMAAQKTREVGIRKVLGASVRSIVYLFSKEFTVLIGIAFLIAAPLGYFLMQEWLSGFHYHIKMGWFIFAGAMVLSVVIAWITVGYRALSAALANPVNSLRSE